MWAHSERPGVKLPQSSFLRDVHRRCHQLSAAERIVRVFKREYAEHRGDQQDENISHGLCSCLTILNEIAAKPVPLRRLSSWKYIGRAQAVVEKPQAMSFEAINLLKHPSQMPSTVHHRGIARNI
jgi:hypothetical protein